MNWFKSLPIRMKMVLLVLFVTASALFISSSIWVTLYGMHLQKDIIESHSILAKTLGRNARAALIFDDRKTSRDILNSLSGAEHVLGAGLYNVEGVLVESFSKSREVPYKSPESLEYSYREYPTYFDIVEAIEFDGSRDGYIHLVVDTKKFWDRIKDQWMVVGSVFVFVLGVSLILILNMQGYILGPILALSESASKVSESSDYSVRVPFHNNDEIGELVLRFNEMLGQIRDQDQKLRGEILERKEMEKQLTVAKEEAENASQKKSLFLSRMSHELRTPLNAILGFAQLMEMDNENLSEDQVENISRLLSAGNYLLDLVNEVLDLSRIEAGELKLVKEKIELENFIEELVAGLFPLSQARNISILGPLNGKPGNVFVMADRMRLNQVLINLFSNAIKYSIPNGMVEWGVENETEGAIVWIQDTGPGLSQGQIERLFEPFDRLGAESTKIEGTGIGLSLSKQLTELMGGEIQVESIVNKGTCFRLKLPAVRDAG